MKKLAMILVALLMVAVLFAGGKKENKTAATGEAKGYTYGEGVTFHSDEKVTYTMYFSDASWYPMVDTWKTEGVFKKIEDATNVHLDIVAYDSSVYTDKITLAINAGDSAYIIPKVYDESKFVDGGAVVAVSDYVKYMPNFTAFYNKYNMKADVDTIVKADGKFYRLPGMHEKALQDYTMMFRKDIFDAAGYNLEELEKTWTWDDLYDILVGVKAYMVKKGMCTEKDYIWSDLWCGSESGQGTGGNLLKIIGNSYGINAGWALGNGVQFDHAKNEWYFAATTDAMKKFLTVINKFVKGGILDPETFTQDDTTATNKFYNGKTVLMSINRGQYATWISGLETGLGKGNFETWYGMTPVALNKYTAESTRLENGVMIARRALDELGEEGFIKMMRFVDWLWYSSEAYTLYKWGPEGETWHYVTDPSTGLQVKALLPGFKCGGLGISGPAEDIDIRLQWGYAGGNFWYGHTTAENADNFLPVLQDFYARLGKYRDVKPLDPAVAPTEDENEQMNLWATPIKDTIASWSLQFILGQKDLNKDWDAYVKTLTNLNSQKLVDLTNTVYKRAK
jgi:putative aldouronate transport system substrate-binding protein